MRVRVRRMGREGDGVKHVLIVGANGRAGRLVRAISGRTSPLCVVEGYLDDDPNRQPAMDAVGVPYLGPVAALDQLMAQRVIDRVYVCLPLRSSYDTAQYVLNVCEGAGVPAYMVADLLPMHVESDGLWCVDPRQTAEETETWLRRSATHLRENTAGSVGAPLFAAFSLALSGLLSVRPALSGRASRGVPPPPIR